MPEKETRALTDIRKGEVVGQKQVPTLVPDVERTTTKEGEVVSKSDYTDEEWDALVAAGAVTDDPKDLVRPKNYKASTVQQAAHADQMAARGNEAPTPQDETNPEGNEDVAETNKKATENARKVKEAEREFDLKLETDADFRASLLTGYEGQPRQHQAILAAARQDFVAEKVYGDDPRNVPGRQKSVTKTTTSTTSTTETPKGGGQ